MITLIIIVVVITSLIVAFNWTSSIKKDDKLLKKSNNKIILGAKNKLTVTNGKEISHYIYQNSTSYGKPQSLERAFIGDKYLETNRVKLNIYDAMQLRIDIIQKEYPKATMDVTFEEK